MLRRRTKPGIRYQWNSSLRVSDSKLKRSVMKRSLKPMKKKREPPALTRAKRIARQRDNCTCQFPGCGKQYKNIDVHHIAKRTQRPDLKFDPNNMICLCRQHHTFTDTHRKEAERLALIGGVSYELAKKQEREAVRL